MPSSRDMCIAGYAVGAHRGFVYVREEYPLAIERLRTALEQAGQKGLLGKNILDSGFDFDIEIVKGAGAFVSGEETAMIAAMEGRRSWPGVPPSLSRGIRPVGKAYTRG